MRIPPVTLQISLAPTDYRHAQFILPHQVRIWRAQVAEILITVDLHRSSGRFSERWEEGAKHILPLANSIEDARVVPIDYGAPAKARVAAEFFGGAPVPAKDFRGGPYYSYFFGLAEARHDYVFHTDSDLFYGGGSQSWMNEAVQYMESHPEALLTAPLSGPPRPDGNLTWLSGEREPDQPYAFRFTTMTTRLFLIDRSRFRRAIGSLRPRRPPAWKNTLIALLEGNPAQDLPEHLFTSAMQQRGLIRRDFLGTMPGMWSLHPPYRGKDFYQKLPELVARIEAGDVPPEQRGDHDMNDSMVDWSEGRAALRQNRLWHRLWRRTRNTR
jgi:hypothetical protein